MLPSNVPLHLKINDPRDAPHSVNQVFPPLSMEGAGALRLDLTVLEVSGTLPTLDVTIKHGPTESGPWSTLGSFTQMNAIGAQHKVFGPCDHFARAEAAIGGTAPAFRFTVTGFGC